MPDILVALDEVDQPVHGLLGHHCPVQLALLEAVRTAEVAPVRRANGQIESGSVKAGCLALILAGKEEPVFLSGFNYHSFLPQKA